MIMMILVLSWLVNYIYLKIIFNLLFIVLSQYSFIMELYTSQDILYYALSPENWENIDCFLFF